MSGDKFFGKDFLGMRVKTVRLYPHTSYVTSFFKVYCKEYYENRRPNAIGSAICFFGLIEESTCVIKTWWLVQHCDNTKACYTTEEFKALRNSEMDDKKFQELVRRIVELYGAEKIARLFDVSRPTIERWAKGQTKPHRVIQKLVEEKLQQLL